MDGSLCFGSRVAFCRNGLVGGDSPDTRPDGGLRRPTYDATTSEPVVRYTYPDEFEGEMILHVSNMVGASHVLKTPVHISTTPYHQQLAPLINVQVKALSTSNGISEIKVTWESDTRLLNRGRSPSTACRSAGSKRQHAPSRSPTSSGRKTSSSD
jgi:hypothetical protein